MAQMRGSRIWNKQASDGQRVSAGLKMPIRTHFFRRAILTRKVGQTELVYVVRSPTISGYTYIQYVDQLIWIALTTSSATLTDRATAYARKVDCAIVSTASGFEQGETQSYSPGKNNATEAPSAECTWNTGYMIRSVSHGGWVTFSEYFRGKGAAPTNQCWCQKTRVIAVSCGIKISVVHHLVLSQYTHLIDGRTDGQNCDSNTVRCITCSQTVKTVMLPVCWAETADCHKQRCPFTDLWCVAAVKH